MARNNISALRLQSEWNTFAANEDLHYSGIIKQSRATSNVFHLKMTDLGRVLKDAATGLGLSVIEYQYPEA